MVGPNSIGSFFNLYLLELFPGTNPPTSSGHVEGTPSRMRPLSGGSLRNECEAAGKDSGDRRFQATSSSTNSKLVKLMDKFEGYVDQLTSAAAKSDEKIQLLTVRLRSSQCGG